MSDERPWEDYAGPIARARSAVVAASTAAPEVGYGEDIAKGAAGGLGRGTAGTLGIGGTVGNLVRSGLSYIGVPEDYLNTGAAAVRTLGSINPVARLLSGPDASQVQKGIENYTGKFYEPKTVPGQYASTLGEFAPSALIPGGGGVGARVLNAVVPALASETAGQLTKDTVAEPYARFAAGVAAGPAAAKAITPMGPASAARQADVALLQREGIPVTAGQRTGSKSLGWMEASAADMPGSAGRAAEMAAEQSAAYNRAVTGRIFDPAQLRARGIPENVNLPDPGAYTVGKRSLQDEYKRLTRNNEIVSDPTLQSDLLGHQLQYERKVAPSQRTGDVEHFRNDIVDTLLQRGGRMPGDVYQSYRSLLGDLGDSAANSAGETAFKGMQKSLDDAMQRNLSPTDAVAWKLNNQRYAVMKDLTPAIAKSGGENLSPQAVAQALRVGNPDRYAAQTGVLDPLSRAATNVIKPLPQSGTAPRLGMQKLFNLPQLITSGTGAAGIGALTGNPLLSGAAALAPFVVPRLVLSKAGQAYLGNQALPQNMRDIISQTMMQQAATQPSGIAQNEAAQAAYERKRKDDRRRQGLQ